MARPYRTRRWTAADADPAACLALTEKLAISTVTAQILVSRGLTEPDAARAFLHADLDRLHSPLLLRDMDRAAGLLRDRAARRRPVLVWGDYDVDGVTGTAMLVDALRRLGAPAEYYIPNRFTEGYGLNAAALERLAAAGHDFILSVDTGTSAVAEAALARQLGITLVVTDHHEPPPELPDVAALVNPKRPDCTYPFKGLSGAGVAFKLIQALLGSGQAAQEYLDIVALATVADLVPLTDENRILVREGLARLATTRRPGLLALKQVAGMPADSSVTAGQVSFSLGPRINALGRMGDAALGVELLLTDNPDRAAALAAHLDGENKERQAIQEEILGQALAQLAELPADERAFAAVLAAEGWHHGVVGICAAKVVEAVHRPALLLAIEDGEARGSARSIPGFHLYRALQECGDLLTRYGGHAMAAGLSLPAPRVPELRRRLNRLVREWLTDEELVPELRVDAWVTPEQVTPALVAELEQLHPYGLGNPEPRLASGGLTVADARPVGKDRTHLKLRLQAAGGMALDAIGFGLAGPGAPGAGGLAPGAAVEAVFAPEMNEWNGRSRLQLRVDDLRRPAVRQLRAAPDSGAAAAGMVRQAAPPAARTPMEVDAAALLGWDPLDGLGAPGGALPEFRALPAPDAGDQAEAVAALAADASGPVLVLVSSPWAVPAAAERIRQALRPLRPPQPGVAGWLPGGTAPDGAHVVVAAWGTTPRRSPGSPPPYAAAVAWHPPFFAGQAAGVAPVLYAAWSERDWALAEAVLGWPYPDRTALVRLFRLLREQPGPVTVAALAAQVAGAGHEPSGPWNLLRVQAGTKVLAELGLLAVSPGGLVQIVDASRNGRGKMNLEASPRYGRGQAGREALRQSRAAAAGTGGVWPGSTGARTGGSPIS